MSSLLNKISSGLFLVQKLAANVPNKQDRALGTTLKLVSMIGIVSEFINPSQDPISDFIRKRNLKEQYSPIIKSFVFDSDFSESFSTRYVSINGAIHLIERVFKKDQSLYFTLWNGSPSPCIYYHPNFDFKNMFSEVWDIYNGRICIKPTMSGMKFSTFSDNIDELYGSCKEKLFDLISRQKQYNENSTKRTYLFIGKPGTGKTTSALRIGSILGNKTLRLDPDSLINLGNVELNIIIKNLEPSFIIIDDIDKISFEDNKFTGILSILDEVQNSNKNTVIIFTANNLLQLDETIIRPGRIDEIHEFNLPSLNDRKEIISGFSNGKAINVASVAKKTSGLSPAWIKEIMIRSQYENINKSISDIKKIHSMYEHKKNKSKNTTLNKSNSNEPSGESKI